MRIRGRNSIYTYLFGAIMLILLIGPSITPAEGKESEHKPTWEWTKKNPKPSWWNWDNAKQKPVRGGYIHAASSAYIGLMNPNHWPVRDWISINNIYDSLAYTDGEYKPTALWLARSYEFKDQVTCILKLKKGIYFHDGSKFNAEAVKYTIDYIKDRNNGCWTRRLVEPVKSIDLIDEYTLQWNFKRPWAGFLGMMSTVPGFMISKEALEKDVAMKALKKARRRLKRVKTDEAKAKYEKQISELTVKAKGGKNVDKFPVGTGKYMLEEAKPGNFLKLKRNPNWWFGQSIGIPDMPYVDGVIVTVIPDESVRLANLRAGRLDFIELSATQYMDLKDDPKFKVTSRVGNHMIGLRFNHAKGPCKDIRVRKAISHAIDRKALIEGLSLGQGVLATGPFHSTHWCHNPNLKPVEYNPELSKKLLAEAGYSKGLTLSGYGSSSTSAVSRTEAMKAMLAKVGINWKVDALNMAAMSDRSQNLEYDLATGGAAFMEEPDLMLTTAYHSKGGRNFGRTNNQKAEELIEAGKAEIDLEKRQKIYWELEKVLYENYEDVWISYPIINTARSKRLMGYDKKKHDQGGEFYYNSHQPWFKDGRRSE